MAAGGSPPVGARRLPLAAALHRHCGVPVGGPARAPAGASGEAARAPDAAACATFGIRLGARGGAAAQTRAVVAVRRRRLAAGYKTGQCLRGWGRAGCLRGVSSESREGIREAA